MFFGSVMKKPFPGSIPAMISGGQSVLVDKQYRDTPRSLRHERDMLAI